MTAEEPSAPGYGYTKLTAAIDDRTSPLRQHLNTTYPNTRLVTAPHNQSSPPIAVTGRAGVNAGTIGTAFDVLVGLRYQPDTIPSVARPFAHWRDDLKDGWANILNLVAEDDTLIESAAWAYALAIEAYRSPVIPYALDDLLNEKGGYNEHDLLAIATADAVEELTNLEALAGTNLYPQLGPPPEPDATLTPDDRRFTAWNDPKPSTGAARTFFAPTFVASKLCSADADIIRGDTLYEIKTSLGTTNARGARVDVLRLSAVYQAITYALFDTSDEYGIRNIGIYSARYGRHTTWPLVELLETLAGRTIDLAEERASVWQLLGGTEKP